MRKGIAFVTVLILTLIALIFSAATIYVSMTSTSISGGEKRYRSALEYAKGISYYLIDTVLSSDNSTKIEKLVPNFNECLNKQCREQVNLPVSNSDYEVNATLLGVAEVSDGKIYTFKVTVKNKKIPSEKVIIEFGYKVKIY